MLGCENNKKHAFLQGTFNKQHRAMARDCGK